MKAVFFLVVIVTIASSIHNVEATDNNRCQLPIVTGGCQAYIPSYGYDKDKNECVQFVYGGCGGNDNRFSAKQDCERACMSKS